MNKKAEIAVIDIKPQSERKGWTEPGNTELSGKQPVLLQSEAQCLQSTTACNVF